MAEKKNIPQIRFKNFTAPWEQRKLGELCTIATGKLDASAAVDDGRYAFFTCSKEAIRTNTYAFDGNAILVNGNGDLGFTRSYAGRFDAYQRTYVLMGFDADYLYVEEAMHRYLPVAIDREAIGGAMPYIKLETLSELPIPIPLGQEQGMISKLLIKLDTLITLHQRKHDKLTVLKKSMLEKMFPKDGAEVPEVRFSGFTNPWEQRKLGEIADFLDDQRRPLESSAREAGPYPYYGASGIIDYVKDYLFDESLVLLSEDGANIIDRNYPVCFLISGKNWVNNHAHVMKSKPGYNDNFLCESLERINYIQYNTGTAQPKLNQEVCRAIEFKAPSVQEQTQIGTFFQHLDTLITLHQRELDILKRIKTACLEKMFV